MSQKLLTAHDVVFTEGLNGDWVSPPPSGARQQVNLLPGRHHDGVFGMWYGKGRAWTAPATCLKHANFAGTSSMAACSAWPATITAPELHGPASVGPRLQVFGDPVLSPADVQEFVLTRACWASRCRASRAAGWR